jgi:hypothetical protein
MTTKERNYAMDYWHSDGQAVKPTDTSLTSSDWQRGLAVAGARPGVIFELGRWITTASDFLDWNRKRLLKIRGLGERHVSVIESYVSAQ